MWQFQTNLLNSVALVLFSLIKSVKFHQIFRILICLFVIAVILRKSVCHKHEISLIKDARPNQEVDFVRYKHEFVVTVIVITEFDCTWNSNIRKAILNTNILGRGRVVSSQFYHHTTT